MIKQLLAIALTGFFCNMDLRAQNWCGTPRFDQEVFSNVTITSNVTYGSNAAQGGGTVTLTLDVYEPSGDTMSQRPLIIFAHGGSFVAGTKNDQDVVALCNAFAKRGYVCASIEYRLGVSFPPSQTGTMQAVFRAVQDMKAAVRFFRKDAATANMYQIDPNMIFAGGSSAGAFTALHMAYLDEPSELPSQIDTTVLGGMDGNSGNPGYSSEVNAVINLCGALGDKLWLHAGDEPLVSMHGTDDATVPYATAIIYYLGIFPIMQVDGSYSIHEHADSVGLMNEMYTYYGAGHVPYAGNYQYMDTTVRFVSNFLYRVMGCTPSDPLPFANTFPTSTGIISTRELAENLKLYPVPASELVKIEYSGTETKIYGVRLLDMQGREQKTISISGQNSVELYRDQMAAGVYLLEIRTNKGLVQRRLVWN